MGAPDLTTRDGVAGPEASVVSVKGARFEVASADQDKLCLLSDGTLYVAQSYQRDMAVLSYMELLRRNKVAFRLRSVTVDEIQRLYVGASAATPDREQTFRQEQVVALVREAVKRGASDVHFRNYEKHTEMWMRIDGFLEKFHAYKAEDGAALCGTMYGSMCDVAEEQYKPRRSQDGRLKREFLKACGLYGARIATRPMEYGNVIVLRLLYSGRKFTLSERGYLSEQIALISRMTKRTTGINIFSGPTGSGKSSSLEALLSELLAEFSYRIHLLTIEDPTEYVIPGAVQTPIICDKDDPEEVARAWVKAISNGMRLDPDVMMVGEMRGRDSAVAAFRAAMTGHGVWTTLHANDAMQILDRLFDMGVNASFLSDAKLVTGLINQSLAPLNCPRCRRPYVQHRGEVDPDLRERIERLCSPERVFLKGNDKTCPQCGGRGYRGRQVIAETVVPTQRLMNEYRSGGSAAARAYWVKEMHGITKCDHLIRRINDGVVDPGLGEQKVCALDEDELALI